MGKKDKIIHPKVKGTEMVFRSISLPASLIEDLKLLKESFEKAWYEDGKRERVTYEKIFDRLLSKAVLGRVEPKVYDEFKNAKETRKEFPAVVTRATRGLVGDIFSRMRTNGSSVAQEALKEIETAEEHLMEDLAAAAGAGDQESPEPVATPLPQEEGKKTEKRFVHPDGRSYKAVPGDRVNWVPVDEKGNWLQMKTVKGFVLKDVEV